MNPIEAILAQYSLIILDGALATELERAGHDLDDPLWSAKLLVEAPEAIHAIHMDYLQAGADCLITATYQATYEGFRDRGLSDEAATALLQKSVQLAIDARDRFWADPANRVNRPRPLIAASIGPYGAYLADGSEYRGDYGLTKQDLIDFHRTRFAALAATGADIFAFETIPSLMEAQALTHLLSEFPDKYAWVSFTAKDNRSISDGQQFVDCVKWLDGYEQIAAIGINCTSPRYIAPLLESVRHITGKPRIIYPNSGEGYNCTTQSWIGAPALADFGQQAWEWYQSGAKIIGGCCRTTPGDIRQIATWGRLLTDAGTSRRK